MSLCASICNNSAIIAAIFAAAAAVAMHNEKDKDGIENAPSLFGLLAATVVFIAILAIMFGIIIFVT